MRTKASFLSALFFLTLFVSFIIKILSVQGNNFPFTYDQGRDLVDIRQMVLSGTPRLVGPTTSINGVLLGPFYYYFILPPYLLFGGSPMAIVIWQIVWYQFSVLLFWFVVKKKSPILADISGVLLSLIPAGFYSGRYFWNANMIPIFLLIFMSILIISLRHKTGKNTFFLGLLSGICLQIEAALGVLFFPVTLLYLLMKKFPWKTIRFFILGYITTLIPQILFELRHGFTMTRTFFNEFTGKTEILGSKLSFAVNLPERVRRVISVVRDSSHIPLELLSIIYPLLIMILIYFIVKRKLKPLQTDYLFFNLLFFILTCIFYFFFPVQIKSWYVLGLSFPVVLFFAVVWEKIFTVSRLGQYLTVAFLLLTCFYTALAHIENLKRNYHQPSNDPSNLKNEIAVIDWIYHEANGEGFRVYSLIPSYFDFQYHYLFWWYGTGQFGFQPQEVSYLPDQPEYIPKSDLAWRHKRVSTPNNLTFLIIENGDKLGDKPDRWMRSFSSLCLVKRQPFPWNIEVRVLGRCH